MRAIPAVIALAALIAQPRFEPVQPELFSRGGTLVNAFADFDGDGDVDLFVGFNGEPNRLYRNDDGRFTDVAGAVGLADARATRAAAWGDADGDGDPDLLLGFAPGAGPVLRLYRNHAGRFVDVTTPSGLRVDSAAVRQPVWVDVDGDGDLDLFVAFRDRPNALFRNDGGRFTDGAAELGLADPRRSVGAVWFDYDDDGDLDLYLGNMDGDANGLYRNGGGRFTDVAETAGVAWGGRTPRERAHGTVRPCAADVNGDGRLDLFTANYGPNGLFLNRGDGRFEEVSAAWGVTLDARYDTCALADIDHDGRIDLYVNGTVTGGVSYRDYLYRNTGSRFEDVTPPDLAALQADHGAQWADVDHDGDPDLALTGVRPDGTHALLRNLLAPADAARSLAVRVVDPHGRATLPGAVVRVFAAGTRRLLGTAMVDAGSGYNAQNDLPVSLGLPFDGPVDVEVVAAAAGRRVTARVAGVRPADWRGRALQVRVDTQAGADWVRSLVSTLAADSMQGRLTGSPGIARAARVIEREMRAIGLAPAGDSGYLHRVPLVLGSNNRMVVLPDLASLDTVAPARRVPAWNLVGVLPGSDPARRDEVVVVSAHYDHVGVRRIDSVATDSIFNGADDNASGTAAMLGVARLMAAGPRPARTVLFVAFTGEERGGLGTRRYLAAPPRPLERTVANFNIEMIGRPDSLAGGPGKAWLTGYERSTMGDQLKAGGIPIVPDPRPEQNFFRRSDNYAFAVRGIPAHTLSTFNLHTDYHRPSDEADRLDYRHMAAVIEAATQAVRLLADGPRPEWKPGGRPEPPPQRPPR